MGRVPPAGPPRPAVGPPPATPGSAGARRAVFTEGAIC